ncbi:T9SS type A sorting domain-containing protein [bacterium]|nr:T9SS type A sorting domain-containing protein [bacterium]
MKHTIPFLILTLTLFSVAFALPVTTEIYSDSLGGTIGIKIYDPLGGGRYGPFAPVLISVPGGWNASLFGTPTFDYMENGMMLVLFLMPGMSAEGVTTEGEYDVRGINCLYTLKDVIKFCAGRIPNTGGDYINDLFPAIEVDTGNVGLVMGSNGSNLGIVTLSLFGPELAGAVKYVVDGENPTGPQTCVTDLGYHEAFPIDGDGNGIPGDDYKNPWYLEYGDTLVDIDLSLLALDTTASTRSFGSNVGWAVFNDGNHNGAYDLITVDSIETPDLNGNGVIDTTEDFIYCGIMDHHGNYNYSTPVAEALYALLGPADYPASVAHPDSAAAFWYLRSAVYHYDNLAPYFPRLGIMILFNEDDHVQVSPDKVHIHHAYSGFTRNGLWARLNPDRAYVAEYFPEVSVFPDNPALVEPVNWLAIPSWAAPNDISGNAGTVSGVLEMADRTHFNVWQDRNLDHVLVLRTPAYPPIYVSVVSHSEEPPGTPDYGDNPVAFAANRAALLAFSNMLFRNQIRLNWQSEWNFARGVALHDDGSGTGGLNIVRYMHDSLNFEIDPHAHESRYNYADVAHFIEDLGVTPTTTVGGFIAWPCTASVYDHFLAPIEADSFPGYFWTPRILWGGATSHHVDEETLKVSGIWKPRAACDFLTHDDAAPLPHVGGYCNGWAGVFDLLGKSRDSTLYSDRIYTATSFVPQGGLNFEYTRTFEQTIHDLEEYYRTDWLRWRTLREVVLIWHTVYDSVPNMYWCSMATSCEEEESIKPAKFEIRAYPNPFNAIVKIEIAGVGTDYNLSLLPQNQIEIFDINGRMVHHWTGEGVTSLHPAEHSFFTWQPDNSISSGIYLIRIRSGNDSGLRKVIFLK